MRTNPNPQQQEAVQTTEGSLLIIAGPGSGKTFTLVERIIYLISEEGALPEEILVATFTEKAAQELITRISDRLISNGIRVNLNEMYLGTFHSICLRLLKEYRDYTRLKRNFTIMDQFDQQYFLYQHLREYQEIEDSEQILGDPQHISWWRRSESLLNWINKVSEEALEPEGLVRSSNRQVRALGSCYNLYLRHLREENALDFSTIQVEALSLLEKHPDALVEIQDKIRYFMVDEYQDTNTIQELILFKLAGKSRNICVVGDDDQGLYRFRGATIRNILEFPDNFERGYCNQVKLETNYRSHPGIIGFYNGWMNTLNWRHNRRKFRFDKRISARTDKDFTDMPIVLKVSGSGSPQNWHREVLAFLRKLESSKAIADWNQVAFLFRSVKNKRVVALAKYLEDNGIPVYSPRSNMFFQREEVRFMLGALIFLFPQFPDARKWRQSVHLDIWEYYDQECFRPFAQELRRIENEPLLKWCRTMGKAHASLYKNTDYAFSWLFYQLLQFPLFSRYMGESSLGGVIDSRPARNLGLISRLLSKFEYLYNLSILNPNYLDKNLRDLFNNFLRFLKEGGLDEYEDVSEYAPSGCVSFFTIHQAKGLEFPVVIVGSMEAVPRDQFTELDEILQNGYLRKPPFEPMERTKFYDFWRLFYTAFSRAQNLLVLSCQERQGHWKTPSKYFEKLYNGLVSWQDESFKPERLELETIRDVSLKNEYSFTSHITLFENCPRQYQFFKELGFSQVSRNPIVFGTLIHQTIEDIHKAVLRGEAAIVTPEQVEFWLNTNYANL